LGRVKELLFELEEEVATPVTTVINLIGGPGCGKSTLAAQLYSDMKTFDLDVEMVREVAKEYAWEGKPLTAFNQISIIGEQIKKESSLFGKVDYIVTDSPVLLGSFYFEHNHDQQFMNKMVQDYYKFAEQNGVRFINFVLDRHQKYNPKGRFESEQEAIQIDEAIVLYLAAENYKYENLAGIHKIGSVSSWIIAKTGAFNG
jgi:deoxyadenosine/deoxycytidine kinase